MYECKNVNEKLAMCKSPAKARNLRKVFSLPYLYRSMLYNRFMLQTFIKYREPSLRNTDSDDMIGTREEHL